MPTDLTESDTFDATVTVPESGDDRTAASVVQGLQALVNRTRHNHNRLNALGDIFSDEHTWTAQQTFNEKTVCNSGIDVFGNIAHPTPPINRLLIGHQIAQPDDNSDAKNSAHRLYLRSGGSGNAGLIRYPIVITYGNEITEARVAALANGSDLTVRLARVDFDKAAAAAGTRVDLALSAPAVIGAGTSGIVTAALVANETANTLTSEYFVEIDVGTDTASFAEVWWVDVRVVHKFFP